VLLEFERGLCLLSISLPRCEDVYSYCFVTLLLCFYFGLYFSTTKASLAGIRRGDFVESMHESLLVLTVSDASHPLSGPRLSQILTSFKPSTPPSSSISSSPPQPPALSDLLDNLTHFSTPTLAHLIALLSHHTPNHPAHNTSLIIIDSLLTLISNAFPRTVDSPATPRKPGGMLTSCSRYIYPDPWI